MAQRYQQGSIDVIQLDERFTVDEIEQIQSISIPAIEKRLPQVIFDLRRLRIIDSAGLNFLCDALDKTQRSGGTTRFTAPCPLIQDVFRITGLNEEFSVYPDLISAAGAFAR